MAEDVKVQDTVLEAGQNEGIERAILPLPQLAYVQNARMRKTGRWGKRFGYSALSTSNLGTGTGNVRAVGPGFALVDDRLSLYDSAAGSFLQASAGDPVSPGANSPVYQISGVASGWLPDSSLFPVTQPSGTNRNSTNIAHAYFGGYLWTAVEFQAIPSFGSYSMFRVTATNPTTNVVVFVQDIFPTVATFSGIRFPRLIACGGTLVLTYLYEAAAATFSVMARAAIPSGSFGAETVLSAAAGITTYDASAYSTTQFVVAITRTAANLIAQLWNASGLTLANAQSIADASANPITQVSIVGNATAGIYIGYGVQASVAIRVLVYSAGLTAPVGTATLSTATAAKPLLAIIPGNTGARVVYDLGPSGAAVLPGFNINDVSTTATAGTRVISQGTYPLTLPFAAGNSVYMWTTESKLAGRYGTAQLMRLPNLSEYPGTTSAAVPMEMAIQDFIVNSPDLDPKGLPAVAQITGTASFSSAFPVLFSVPVSGGVVQADVRLVRAKHYTDSAAYRGLQPVAADSGYVVPMGTLTRVEERRPTEVGFAYAPFIAASNGSAGGGLTASSTYFYTAVYRSRSPNGRFEQSGFAVPSSGVTGVGQGTISVAFTPMTLTNRRFVQIDIYRTLANGQTYYLVASLDASPGISIVSFTDTIADTVIAQQQALYTQVGQQLPNALPPASRFGCSGGGRVFLGGLIRPDIVQASKLILGDQSPSFAATDAFKIVLPAPCTGLAWMDGLVLFTRQNIYLVPGDGPDDSGAGDFGTANELPFALGCIEPRSVVTVDDGTFFQSARGLYLLPRGAGAPVPAGDAVMDTLAMYPIITGSAVTIKATEETIRWTCVSNASASLGAVIVFDLVHKCWSIDLIRDTILGAQVPQVGAGQWLDGESVLFGPTLSGATAPLRLSNSTYSDGGELIELKLRTGDIRPFGVSSHGELQRFSTVAELRSACTLSIAKITDQGVAAATRVFSGTNPDYQVGQIAYTETSLGWAELRDITALTIQLSEASQTEGLAFVSLSLESGETQGLRLDKLADRNT